VARLSIDQMLSKGGALLRKGKPEQAMGIFEDILTAFPENSHAKQGLSKAIKAIAASQPAPPQEIVNKLVSMFNQGQISAAVHLAERVRQEYPHAFFLWNILGAGYLRLGNLEHATNSFRKACELNPHFCDGYNNLGVALKAQNKLEEALQAFQEAMSINPKYAEPLNNIGNVLRSLERREEARDAYEKAVRLKPNFAEAFNNLGVVLLELGNSINAIKAFQNAVNLRPDYVEALQNIGNALIDIKEHERAISMFQKLASLTPSDANLFFKLGSLFAEREEYNSAVEAFKTAILHDPNHDGALNNLGNTLAKLGQLDDALIHFERAIELKPDESSFFFNKGKALESQNRHIDAIAAYKTAISLRPDYAEAYVNLGNALVKIGEDVEGLKAYDKSYEIDSDNVEPLWNKSLVLLRQGDFEKGWRLYETRWDNPKFGDRKPDTDMPYWLGDFDISGKSILLFSEQGLGDTIQFSRLARDVARLGAKVTLAVQKPLKNLLGQIDGVSEVIAYTDALPRCDCMCSLMSLPLALQLNVNNLDLAAPYLVAESKRIDILTTRLGATDKPRIGLAWSGSLLNDNDHNRSISLSDMVQYLSQDIDFYCLQKDIRPDDQEALSGLPSIKTAADLKMGTPYFDFDDTAALCSLMDRVVTVDTSIAHLAGALGIPATVMLPSLADFRWLKDRNDSLWYGCVELVRRTRTDKSWDRVIEQAFASLPTHQD